MDRWLDVIRVVEILRPVQSGRLEEGPLSWVIR